MRAAADHEDQTEKHAVTPGPIMPARELLGDMLMELGRPADALPQYEASIAKEPNRFRGLYGAGLAAERAGDRRGRGGISRSSSRSVPSPTARGLSWCTRGRCWRSGKAPARGVRGEDTCMHRKRWWIGILLVAAVLLRSPAVRAVESDPLPAPKGTPRERAVSAYNEGVTLMRDKHYAAAQEKFEQALALDETLAEAHNNLAFSLRHAGDAQLRAALQHYNRALELKPDLARAYMYRGVLFTQMGDHGPRPRRPRDSSWGSTRSWPPSLNASSPAPTDATNTTAWQGRRRGVEP